jgi:hypothetical protein
MIKQSFWTWFEMNHEYINNELDKNPDDIALLIREQLDEENPNIHFDIPFKKHNNKRQFILSADGIQEYFTDVIRLYENHPHIEGWEFILFRPRTYQIDQVIDMDGLQLSYEDIFFKDFYHNDQLYVDVYIKGYQEQDHRYVHAYFILLDTLIGEFDAVTYITQTRVYPYTESQGLKNIVKIVEVIDSYKSKTQ